MERKCGSACGTTGIDDKITTSLGNDKQIIDGKKGCVMINGRSRVVLNHRLLNLSFNTTHDVTKQLELSRKNLLTVDQRRFKITDC